MNEKEILNKFEQDFNSGATIAEGLEIAFNNLPDGFLENDKTGKILTRLRQLKDTSRDSAVVAVAEVLIEDINSLIYIIAGLVYIIAGAVLLSTEKKALDKIVYSEQKLEQQRLVAYIYNLNYLIK